MTPRAVVPAVAAGELVDRIVSAQRVLTRGIGTAFEQEGISVDQWRTLRALSTDDGRPMGELAAALEIPHPTLTRLVDGLVDSAHLYRTQSDQDRRRVSVHLSHRGEQLLARLEALASAHEAALRDRHGAGVVNDLLRALESFR